MQYHRSNKELNVFMYLNNTLNKDLPEEIDCHCRNPLVCFKIAKANSVSSNHTHSTNYKEDGDDPSNEVAVPW